jgi:hypothetical protein
MGGWCVVTIGPEGFCQIVQCPDGWAQAIGPDGWAQAIGLEELRQQTMPPPAWMHFVRRAFTLGEFDQRGPASDEMFHTVTEGPA